MTFLVTLVRHGETDWNKNDKILTYTDQPLNDTGKKQANLLGNHLRIQKFTKAYTSNLMRTYQTAEGILGANENPIPNIVQDPRLTEKNLSEALEGTCGKDFWEKANTYSKNLLEYIPPGGETYESVRDRVASFFKDLCLECKQTTEIEEPQRVLIVSHGLVILHLMEYFYTDSNVTLVNENDEIANPSLYRRSINNTGVANLEITELVDSHWKVKLLVFNDTTHFTQ